MMKEEMLAYLDDIDVTKTVKDNVERIYEIVKLMCPEEIEEVFVTNIIADNGISQYLNAWFIAQTYVVEAKNFMLELDLDILPILNNITYVQLKVNDYDLKSADENSRLFVLFTTATSGVTGEFVSVGKNCQYLMEIYNRRILPNMKISEK